MQKFKFRLQSLLDVRQRNEESIKLKLAEARKQTAEMQMALKDLSDELKQLQSTQKENRENANDIVSLRYSVSYRHKLKQDMISKGGELAECQKKEQQVLKELITAKQQTRALELLRENRFKEWRKKYLAKEQEINNDISQQGHIRKMREASKRISSAS